MELDWKYIANQFLNETEDSIRKAIILSNWHDGALHALKLTYPQLIPLYDRYHPLHLALEATYSFHQSVLGGRIGETLNLEQIFAAAVLKHHVWDIAIQGFYLDTTVRYKQIFPFGFKPFHHNPIDLKINAYNTLSLNIGTDANLAAVKADVDAVYALLDNARDVQNGAKGATKDGSGVVKNAVEAAMVMQYRNGGNVMDNLYEHRKVICNAIFDLQTLRRHAPVKGNPLATIEGNVLPMVPTPTPNIPPGIVLNGNMTAILRGTDVAGTNAIQSFYFAKNNTDGPEGYIITVVLPAQKVERTLEEMGWSPENTVLMAFNSGTAEGHYTGELYA